jgi:hypothetical protein
MRATHFIPETAIDEAAMNPSTFARAVESGDQKGVLVGFEFEVCIPKETVENYNKSKIDTRNNDQLPKQLEAYRVFVNSPTTHINPSRFDQVFKIKQGTSKYSSVREILDSIFPERIEELRQLFYSLPEKTRMIARSKTAETYQELLADTRSNSVGPKELLFTWALGNYLYYNSKSQKVANIGREMRNESRIYWTEIFERGWGIEADEAQQRFNELFDYDTAEGWKFFQPYMISNDDEENNYRPGAETLAAGLENTFPGKKIIIFDDYHERPKDATSWYVEPDSSLEPSRRDSAAEVVTPPMPAAEAMQNLKQFYTLAGQMNLYTSADNNTGLHINVSIPKNVDVLKLALFLGDRYVLEQYDRLDNDYAKSTLAALTSRVDYTDSGKLLKTKKQGRKKTLFNQPAMQSEFNRAMLNRLAQDSTQGHYQSISHAGKYFSFRQAGGNYLGRPEDVINTVGRFVQAMIIASDADMYRNEYISKLNQLVNKNRPLITQDDPVAGYRQVIAYVRQNGLPAIKVDAMKVNKYKWPEIFKAAANKQRSVGDVVAIQPNNQEAMSNFKELGAAIYGDNYRPSASAQDYATAMIIPDAGDIDSFTLIASKKFRQEIDTIYRRTTAAKVIMTKVNLPVSDPITRQFLINTMNNLKSHI